MCMSNSKSILATTQAQLLPLVYAYRLASIGVFVAINKAYMHIYVFVLVYNHACNHIYLHWYLLRITAANSRAAN